MKLPLHFQYIQILIHNPSVNILRSESRDSVHIRNENNEKHPIEFNPFKTEAVIIQKPVH